MINSHIVITLPPEVRLNEQHYNALAFASRSQSKVTILTVIDSLDRQPAIINKDCTPFELLKIVEQRLSEQLRDDIEAVQPEYPDVQFSHAVVKGTPYREIIKFCIDKSADIIVTGAGTTSRPNKAFFSSTVKHLMRKSPIPIWATTHSERSALESIAVAVDLEFGSEQQSVDSFNRKLIEHALKIATEQQCSITLLHAWQLYGKDFLKHWSQQDDLYIARLAEQEFNERKTALQELIAGLDAPVELQLIEGSAKESIAEYVNTTKPDLLIMGTVSRTGLSGFFIGNTAESVIDSVSCSILTVKPDDFKSPLQSENDAS